MHKNLGTIRISQALIRLIIYKKQKKHDFIKKLMAYLPQEHMIPAFEPLRASSPNRRLEPLLSYMERIWCSDNARYHPESWSVYSLLIRTNNDKEGWHRMINGKAGANRSFYLLWELLLALLAEGTSSKSCRRANPSLASEG